MIAYNLQFKLFLHGDILLQTDATNITDNFLSYFKLLQEFLIHFIRLEHLSHHQTGTRFAFTQLLPQFFCDKRHERMQHFEQTLERAKNHVVNKAIDRLTVSRFHNLQQPGREFIPEQFVNQHQCFAQTIFGEEIRHFNCRRIQSLVKPLNCQMCIGRNLNSTFGICPSFYQTESIPYLVAEITSLLTKRIVEKDVVSGRSRKHHAHTYTVSTVLLNQFQWIGRVTERFGHLTSQFITNDTCEINILERHLSFVFITCHNHAGYPEENNVRACHEVTRRIVIFDFFIPRIVDSIEQRDRPQPGREPGIQAVFILTEVIHCQGCVAGLFLSFRQCFFGSSGYYIATFRQEVGRNTMSPPQLTADTPVLDVLHPVTVRVLIFCRIELQVVVHYRRQCHIRKVLHLEEPLHGQFRFDHYIRTFRISYLVCIGFRLFQQAGSFKIFFDLLADIETIHSDIHAGSFAQCTVIIEDVNARQIVLFAQHIVVYVMSRSHFQATCTKLDIYIIIFNHRYCAVYQRNDYFLSFQPCILRVVRVDTHCRVTHDCFGTGGCHYCISAFCITFHFVTEIIQFSVLFLVDYFFVRKSGQCFRIPVHHADTAIDQSFIEQVYKYFKYTFTTFLVHSECCTIPVAGCTEFAKLFQNDATVFVCPVPSMFQKLVAGQVGLLDALGSKFIYDFRFSGDGSMVSSRHPAGILAFHTGTANQNILDGIIKHVSHVQHTSDVRGWNDDGVRFTTIGFRTE